MTRAEYLEFVEEALAFALNAGIAGPGGNRPLPPPELVLRDTPQICRALRLSHARYCTEVEIILFPERAEEARKELAGVEHLARLEAELEDPIQPGVVV
jgi:hypothetical protein